MSVASACPHCQQPLPDGYIGKACPHCRGALANKRKRSLSGFSFQAMTPGTASSSRPPHASVSSVPPREVVEDLWDLPDLGVEPARPRGAVPPAAPTGFPPVSSPMTAKMLRSTMALGVQVPDATAPATPIPLPAAPPPPRPAAARDPFAWDLDHSSAPASRNSAFDVRALKQTAIGFGGATPPSPRPGPLAPAREPATTSLRKTALGVAPLPREASPLLEVPDDVPEADAFPLVRSTQPSGTAVTTRPPPSIDPVAAMADAIDIPSAPPSPFVGSVEPDEPERPSLMPYSPLRAPPSRRPGPPATGVAWWWSVGGAALALAAGFALRSAPLSVALRAAAAAASLLMLARFGGLSMRALLLLLVALPALAQEALSVAALSRAGAGVLTGALVLLPTGAWISAERPLARRALLVVGVALTVGAALMPGGVTWPWSLGAAPVLALALAAFVSSARWVSAALTVAAMAWAAACGASGGASALSSAASAIALAALVLVCGRALAAVVESDD